MMIQKDCKAADCMWETFRLYDTRETHYCLHVNRPPYQHRHKPCI